MKRLVWLLSLLMIASHGGELLAQSTPDRSQDTQPQVRRPTLSELVNTPVVYSVPGMDQVKVRKDLNYKGNDANPLLKMDVYIPQRLGLKDRRPAVIFIHGGTGTQYRPKDWGFYVSWGRLVAASGMVGVTFTHRLGYPKPQLTEAASDVTDALNYVRANADSLNVDKERICLAAYSAGGPLLSMAMREKPVYVRCLVAFYAFMDIQQSDLHKQHETPEMVKKFSPLTYLATDDTGGIAPIFIARAGRDAIPAMNDSIDRFIREALNRNVTIDFANHPQGVHGFDNQNNDARSREIIRRVIDFMRTHLGLGEA